MRRTVLGYIRPYAWRMTGGIVVKMSAALAELTIPWILSYMIDTVIPTRDVRTVVLWGGIMIVCSLGVWVGNILANRMANAVSRDVVRTLRHDLFARISYLSSRQVDRFTVSSLISRMTSDTYTLHQTIGMAQRMGVRAPILLLGGIAVTLTLDPILTLVMLCTLPVGAAAAFVVSRRGVRLYRGVQRRADHMFTVVRENITGARVIKALSKEPYEIDRFDGTNKDLTQAEFTASKTMAVIDPIVTITLNLGLVLVVIVGAFRVNAGLTEIGKIVAFLNYFTIILQSLMAITRIFTNVSRAVASGARVEEVLNTEEELYEETSRYQEPKHQAPAVEFDHVDFSYDTGGFGLHDITFTVKKGETLGIIGATGSGKTTIVQALLRFYDVQKGQVRINGIDVKEYSSRELRDLFGVVFQNDVLFQDTIAENIDFGRGLSEEELWQACSWAQADEFVREAGGLSAPVAIQGANLSGGQRQRLLLARALAAKPAILLLDDSSSALDYRTDAALRRAIRENLPGTTKIIVAQRISSVMHAEQIAVLENGKIVALGRHEELLQNCPLYQAISRSQLGGGMNG